MAQKTGVLLGRGWGAGDGKWGKGAGNGGQRKEKRVKRVENVRNVRNVERVRREKRKERGERKERRGAKRREQEGEIAAFLPVFDAVMRSSRVQCAPGRGNSLQIGEGKISGWFEGRSEKRAPTLQRRSRRRPKRWSMRGGGTGSEVSHECAETNQ